MGIATGSFAEYAVADAEKLAIKPGNDRLRTGCGVHDLGDHRAAGTHHGRWCRGRAAGARHRSLGRSRLVRRADRQGARRDRYGCGEHSKLDFVSLLGADAVVDYATTDITDLDEQFDLIIDIGGRSPLMKLRRILTDGHLRDRGRRERRTFRRRRRPQPSSGRAVDVRPTTADVLHQQREPRFHRPARRDARRLATSSRRSVSGRRWLTPRMRSERS